MFKSLGKYVSNIFVLSLEMSSLSFDQFNALNLKLINESIN